MWPLAVLAAGGGGNQNPRRGGDWLCVGGSWWWDQADARRKTHAMLVLRYVLSCLGQVPGAGPWGSRAPCLSGLPLSQL